MYYCQLVCLSPQTNVTLQNLNLNVNYSVQVSAPIDEHYMLLLSKETVQMALHFPVVFTHSWGLGWEASASTAS